MDDAAPPGGARPGAGPGRDREPDVNGYAVPAPATPPPPVPWQAIPSAWPTAPHRVGPPADYYEDEWQPAGAMPDDAWPDGRGDAPTAEVTAIGADGRPATHRRPGPGRRRAAMGGALALVLLAGAGVLVAVQLNRGDAPPQGAGVPTAALPPAAPPDSPTPPPPPPPPPATVAPSPTTTRPPPPAGGAPGADGDDGGGQSGGRPAAPPAARPATLAVLSDADELTVRTADLGGRLVRVDASRSSVRTRSDGAGVRVEVAVDDDAEILVDQGVRWTVDLRGRVEEAVVDLSDGRTGGIAAAAGADSLRIALPRLDGPTGVELGDVVGECDIRTAGGEPVRLRLRQGAGVVTLRDALRTGLIGDVTLSAGDVGGRRDRLEVQARAVVGQLTVDAAQVPPGQVRKRR